MTITLAPAIKTASEADRRRVIATLIAAFAADPAARWMYPDERQYRSHFPGFVQALGGRAFAARTAHFSDGFAGAVLWLPPGVGPDEDALMRHVEETATGINQSALMDVLEEMGGYHPEEPHWYLPLIGVEPAMQSRGLGAALLRHGLRACDRDRLPAYLESSNPRNVPLYQRHGFELLGTIQKGSSPPILPMLRRPR
jgi:GNAT superfamily N-acetyltransferase